MSRPPVTAIIPTHNRPELMRRAVESVLNQHYDGEIEILVVFDASEPVLPDVVLSAGRSLTALVNDRSRGLAGGRNTGITAATHRYVAFLDDDDYWLPEKLERQIGALEDSPESILVGTAMMVDDGSRTHERLVPSSVVTHEQLLHNRLAGLHSSSFVFRRDALHGNLGLIDETLPRSYGEDYDILLRSAKITPVLVVNEPLVTVAWQGQSYFFGKWALYAQALEYLLHKHPEFELSGRAIGRIESQIAFALAASGQRRLALKWARTSLLHDPRQAKAYLAIAIVIRIVSAERIARVAQRFGKGI